MGQMDEKMDKILELFYENPDKAFTIREIVKLTKIPKSTVQNYLEYLKSKSLVTKENAASKTRLFRIKKIHHFIEKIYNSGLIDYLEKELVPSCIILFGSIRKGDSVKESDIDIFVEATKKADLSLARFEDGLGHKIQVFKEPSIKDAQPRLFNNILNGIKLEGYLKIK